MRTKYDLLLIAAISVFSLAFSPGRLVATTVNPSDPTCGTSSNPTCYTTIQAAIKAATSSSTIEVMPGTYNERITLRSDFAVSLKGWETARTIMTGGGSGTIIAANGTPATTNISGFTLTNALVGIDVTGNSTLKITNNVFTTCGTGIQVQNTTPSLVTLENNVFYKDDTAVTSNNVISMQYTIFANNATAIATPVSTAVRYNCFSSNTTDGMTGDTTNNVSSDPLFVSPLDLDFHLQEGSLCINAGDPAGDKDIIDGSTMDLGAYGGLKSDTIPFPVKFSPDPPLKLTGDSIDLSWTANLSSLVTSTDPAKQGGYHIHYSLNQKGAPYLTKVTLASTSTSTQITGLVTSIAPPDPPALRKPGFDDRTLLLSWPSVTGATGYNIYYLVTGGSSTTPLTATTQDTSFEIGNLENGTLYTVWVTATTQPVYYFAVTAFDSTSGPFIPGSEHESEYSPESTVLLGSPVESAPSRTFNEYPEKIEYHPNLANKGCFIATAAYGYYDAPQVQALRELRDRYLETNSVGRAFVRWYYEYGPIGAAALNEHPWLKPVARTALMPAVGGALFLTRTSPAAQLLALALLCLLAAVLIRYKKGVRRGGLR